MKNCTDCRHAQWRRREDGNLHPYGNGMCGYVYKPAQLPASMYWIGGPNIGGGAINRRKELPLHCVYWSKA
jgi:hypothetical protein